MNNATSSSIVHLIIPQFTAAYATTTTFAAAATALTTKNGTTIPIITPTAAFGCIPTAYQFIAIYFATANIATVAADASLFMSDLPLQQQQKPPPIACL